MLSRKFSLVVLATSFLVGITTQSAVAFTITPQPNLFNRFSGASKRYQPINVYNTKLIKGMTYLDPKYFEELELGGTQGFLRKLEQTFGQDKGWRYERGQNLNGRFDIEYYYACGYESKCGGELTNPRNGAKIESVSDGVGSAFQLRYYPGQGDPTPGGSTLHWIQWVNSVSPDTGYVDIIDNKYYPESPFYDMSSTANEEYFVDRSYRSVGKNQYWTAELYLVEVKDPENAPQTVTIRNGGRWGWKNKISKFYKKIVDSLSSNNRSDSFQLSELTPGAKFYAYIDNDIPGNICNPNTYLTAYDGSGYTSNSDDNSSQIGDGFASALTGTVSSNGTINLNVSGISGGRLLSGSDEGKYELSIMVFDEEEFPFVVGDSSIAAGSSGGGGVGDERPGRTQSNPILPNGTEQGGWQVFRNVPGCQWYDPTTSYGFEFQALDDTLFTEILDFPALGDHQFTVSVGDTVVGSKGPGQSLDFVSLLGQGVSNFKITGIDSKGPTEETAFKGSTSI